MLVTVDNASFSYGDNLIFSSVTFTVNEGERIGLIGANGEGKTTLIKLILGEITADVGTVSRKNGLRIGYLQQDGGYESGNTVYNEMLAVFKEEIEAVDKLAKLSSKLSETPFDSREYNVLAAKIESLNKYLIARDCYDVEVKIKTVLNGMGFSGMYGREIYSMSGGEKTRLKLARLLLESPDLLILDEPTNHLDINTLFWLEDYLKTFKGAIFVVSHDRYFLDRTVTKILEIENKETASYSGNYTKYKSLKAERVARQLKEYEAQQELRAKLQDYVDRNLVRATTSKSAQSRVKQLEKMELIPKPYVPPRGPSFRFDYVTRPYEDVLEIKDLNLVRSEKTLITGGNLSIKRGSKVALIGENGTGKSSLLKEIVNGNPAIRTGRFVKTAYYDQESANLNGDNTVLAELWERHVGYTQTEARSALARCGLYADDMQKPVKALSGGERAKLALCILECEHGNFLLLDEPTNHLDLPAREGLENALKQFDGTLLFVSHDRYFISALAEHIVEINDGKLNLFEGDYAAFNAEKQRIQEEKRGEAVKPKLNPNSHYRSGKERAQEEKLKKRIKEIESAISELEERENEINALLSESGVAADYKRVNGLLSELEEIKNSLDALYNEYASVL